MENNNREHELDTAIYIMLSLAVDMANEFAKEVENGTMDRAILLPLCGLIEQIAQIKEIRKYLAENTNSAVTELGFNIYNIISAFQKLKDNHENK